MMVLMVIPLGWVEGIRRFHGSRQPRRDGFSRKARRDGCISECLTGGFGLRGEAHGGLFSPCCYIWRFWDVVVSVVMGMLLLG